MVSENLIVNFKRIDAELNIPEYLKKICDIIVGGTIIREKVDGVLRDYQISHKVAKIEFLHLIFAYIKIALEDDILSPDEKADIKFLKTLFRVKEGDFYCHNKLDVEETIMYQLSKIYNDDFVTEKEADLKIDMQEIFDLSFDQMNDYSKERLRFQFEEGLM